MSLTVSIPPYAEPISIEEMKIHLKIQPENTEEDANVASDIVSARDMTETGTSANVHRMQVMVATTFELTLDFFPACASIEIPRVPLISVESVTYIDMNGNLQTLDSGIYAVSTAKGRITLAYGEVWPSVRYQEDGAVTVRFTAGMVAPFAVDAATDIVTVLGRSFAIGDRVRLMNSGGALPTGLNPLTDYFVIAGQKLSLTSGGAAKDITGTGSGISYIGVDFSSFETGRKALKLLCGHWHRNRSGVNVGNIVTTFPLGYESLVASIHA